MSRLRTFQIALAVVVLGAASVAVWDLVMGGFYFRVLGIRLSSWEAYKPFRVSMLAAVTASLVIAVHYGIFAAGGADAYGYVSQAALWAAGHLSAPDPLASVASLVGPADGPLGYKIARTPGLIVPTYPAGLPIAMAIATAIGGPSAVYLVVAFFCGLAVWGT
jgi:hypothetical protein